MDPQIKEALKVLGFEDPKEMPKMKEIAKKFRILCLLKHPDKPGGTKEAFQELLSAYDIAGDAANKLKKDENDLEDNIARKIFEQFKFMSIKENMQTFTIIIEKEYLKAWNEVLKKNFGDFKDNGVNGKKFSFKDKCFGDGSTCIFLTIYHTCKILLQAEKNNHLINIHFVHNHLENLYKEVYKRKTPQISILGIKLPTERIKDSPLVRRIKKRSLSLPCGDCDFNADNAKSMKDHKKTTHKQRTLGITAKFHCSLCQNGFNNEKELSEHEKKEHESSIDIEEAEVTTQQNNVPLESHICTSCTEEFGEEIDLEAHIKDAHECDKQIKCDSCELLFSTNSDLMKHKLSSHNDSLKCDKCEFTSTSELWFRQHILTVHAPGFQCHECESNINPKDLVVLCSGCEFYYHKRCTNLAKSQGGHWKPKSWKCGHCSSKNQTEETSTQVSNLNLNPEAEPFSIAKDKPQEFNHIRTVLSGRHRRTNINLENPDTELLQSQLDSCRSIIAQREAEVKKIKESDILKAKRIMQLEAQLQEARHMINTTSSQDKVYTPTPGTSDENLAPNNSHENTKVLLLESRTNALEHQLTLLLAKLDTMHSLFSMCKQTLPCQPPEPEKMFTCDQCDEMYLSKSELKKHKVSHKNTYTATDDVTLDVASDATTDVTSDGTSDITSDVTSDPLQNREGSAFECKYCEFTTTEKISLNLHMETHNISCDNCSYIAIHPQDLRRHKQTMHATQKNYVCKQCDFFSLDGNEFEEHCKEAHVKVQETRVFFRKVSELPKCEKCSYRGANPQDMIRHMKSMHKAPLQRSRIPTSSGDSSSSPSPATPSKPTPSASSGMMSPRKDFHCNGPCDAINKSFAHRDEYDLHMSYYHTTQ